MSKFYFSKLDDERSNTKIMTSKLELVRITKAGEPRMGIMKGSLEDLSAEIAKMMKAWTLFVIDKVYYNEIDNQWYQIGEPEKCYNTLNDLFEFWNTEIYLNKKK